MGVDLTEPPEIPPMCSFVNFDVLNFEFSDDPLPHFTSRGCDPNPLGEWCTFDFICASSPCEQFSVHGMKHFHPNPPYPELGIKLFNHTREICEASGVPYVMENVRAAQQFVGQAVHHCGPFYLWGSGVPPLMNQGIKKNLRGNGTLMNKAVLALPLAERRKARNDFWALCGSKKLDQSRAATIPPELSNCVADYAERILAVTA